MSDYESFMEWFKENHPALCKKYSGNITISPFDGKAVGVNTNNRISPKEFDMLNVVAHSFYSKEDIDLFDTLEYIYPPETRKDEGWETAMLINVTMWLRPLIKRINKESGVVKVNFIKPGFNTYWVDNVSDEIITDARVLSERHKSPYHPEHNP